MLLEKVARAETEEHALNVERRGKGRIGQFCDLRLSRGGVIARRHGFYRLYEAPLKWQLETGSGGEVDVTTRVVSEATD